MSEARRCILQLRTRLGSVNKHGGRWALGPRNTGRALGLQSPVVLRVDDLGEQLLSLVTTVVPKVSSHSQEQLGLADTAVSRASRSLLILEGSKDRRDEAGP